MQTIVYREITSGLSHLFGAFLSVAALVLLVIVAAQGGTAKSITGFAIFGATLIILYSLSSVYHFLKKSLVKDFFQKLDRTAIYLLIAGTYTAVSLVLPNSAWGWSLFGVEWGLATMGAILEFSGLKYRNYIAPALYLSMGWLAIIALPVLLSSFPPLGIFFLVAGGILYTLGFVCFVLDNFCPRGRFFSFHDVFHLLVIGGSFSQFWFLLHYAL